MPDEVLENAQPSKLIAHPFIVDVWSNFLPIKTGIIPKDLIREIDHYSPLKRSRSLDDIMSHNRLNPPIKLATVLENMPLVYNSNTKSLERSDDRRESCPLTNDDPNSDCFSTSKPFKRGHIRRSSYESTQIQFLPTPTSPISFPSPIVGRTNSFNRYGSNIAGYYVRSETAPKWTLSPCTMNAVRVRLLLKREGLATRLLVQKCNDGKLNSQCVPCHELPFPIIGESLSSKQSSLDRKSQTSCVDWASDLEFCCSPQDEDQLESVTNSSTGGERKRGVIPLPIINLPRGLFSRSKPQNGCGNHPWKLFSDRKCAKESSVVSTTGLILENRPSHLPAKSEKEESKHKQQYHELIEAAKKKEQKVSKERKKTKELQKKLEDKTAATCKQWTEHILPKWEEMKDTKRCQELWWQGIPPKVRGRVWSLVIGNELNLTEELYKICIARAKERLAGPIVLSKKADSDLDSPSVDRENTVELIHLDVSRTFPNLGIFQEGGPYYDLLLNLVGAYVCYRPDVGYVQSMSFLAAVLLLQMEPFEAFVAFANLLNRPLQLAFFRLRQPQMTEYFIDWLPKRSLYSFLSTCASTAYDQYFAQELPKLHEHFDTLDIRPDLYLIEWIYTLYAKSLPLDATCRVWDVFLRDGEEFLFKTALGILRCFESCLLALDFDGVVHFLSHLPESPGSFQLFRNIEPFMRPYTGIYVESAVTCRRRFQQILSDVNERIGPTPMLSNSATFSHERHSSDASRDSQLSQFSSNVQNVQMSKSLSGFLGDLLRQSTDQTGYC